MEEIRQWVDTWQRYLKDPLEGHSIKDQLIDPIKANDSVLNELLAKELYNSHLVEFVFNLLSHDSGVFGTTIVILMCLSQSSSAYCKRLSAMCVPALLLIEWTSTAAANKATTVHESVVKCIETIFVKQEQSVHQMASTVRIPAIGDVPPREVTRYASYYAQQTSADQKWAFSEFTRLPTTLRLSLLYIDYASESPKEIVLLFNIVWVSLLSPPDKLSDALEAELKDILGVREASLVKDCAFQSTNRTRSYTGINDDLLVILLEWVLFAMDRSPTSSKILHTLLVNRAKADCLCNALLLINSSFQ